jgi:hypothetical protein
MKIFNFSLVILTLLTSVAVRAETPPQMSEQKMNLVKQGMEISTEVMSRMFTEKMMKQSQKEFAWANNNAFCALTISDLSKESFIDGKQASASYTMGKVVVSDGTETRIYTENGMTSVTGNTCNNDSKKHIAEGLADALATVRPSRADANMKPYEQALHGCAYSADPSFIAKERKKYHFEDQGEVVPSKNAVPIKGR